MNAEQRIERIGRENKKVAAKLLVVHKQELALDEARGALLEASRGVPAAEDLIQQQLNATLASLAGARKRAEEKADTEKQALHASFATQEQDFKHEEAKLVKLKKEYAAVAEKAADLLSVHGLALVADHSA